MTRWPLPPGSGREMVPDRQRCVSGTFCSRRAPYTFDCDALQAKKKAAKSKGLNGRFRVTFITQPRSDASRFPR